MQTIFQVIFFLFFTALQLHAQHSFDNPVFFGIADGLPGKHVEDFAEDEYGFMWIATRSGLCRFDGSKISVIKKTEQDSVFFNSNHIRKIFLTGDTMWLGTAKGLSILILKPGQYKTIGLFLIIRV